MLDSIDRALLDHLQRDGKASIQELAEGAGLSASPCWRRVRRLQDAGIITGYTVRLDPKQLGLNALAYVFVSLIDHREETMADFARLVTHEPRIIESASITGAFDYLLKVAARDPEDLERVLMQGILRSGLVRNSQTNFVLRHTKPTSAWPVIAP